jgi:hypothetical protein
MALLHLTRNTGAYEVDKVPNGIPRNSSVTRLPRGARQIGGANWTLSTSSFVIPTEPSANGRRGIKAQRFAWNGRSQTQSPRARSVDYARDDNNRRTGAGIPVRRCGQSPD